MEKNIGIWLDSDQAIIIENGKDSLHRINSEVEHFNMHGGNKGFGQVTTSDTKLLNRQNHQLKNYFQKIIKELPEADKIVVFGPAETKIAFKSEVENNNGLKNKLQGVETANSRMSDAQLVEWVRNYYK